MVALRKRPYISFIDMDREGRKRLRDCPCCHERIKKERSYDIDEKLLGEMLKMIKVMSVAKCVVLVNKTNPIENIPSVERERCSEFDQSLLEKAEVLGLIQPFMDGARKTYFTDALDFFLNEESHSPSHMVTLQGVVVETSGAMYFDDVKIKDKKSRDRIKREFRDAIKAIPESTITFVKNGQLSLV